MSNVRLERVSKSFGDFHALKDISLDIGKGEFVTLLGGSGSGKTTCLRLVAGFLKPDQGRVHISGQDVTDIPPHRRDTGMVFQSYALFPHMTAAQNVAYGLRIRRLPRDEVNRRTREALSLVQLDHLADRYPHQLSGGQRQRVALARAVVIRPKVMLLDEPLGALDLKLRQELQVEIKRVQQSIGITTLFVTHDQGEALSLSDRVIVMRDGRVLQADAPDRLYCRPVSRYVADFVGRMNFFPATVVSAADGGEHHTVRLGAAAAETVTVTVTSRQVRAFKPGEQCVLGVRPEDLDLTEGAGNSLPVQVLRTTYSGNAWSMTCAGGGNGDIQAVVHASRSVPAPASAITLNWPPSRCVLLDHE